MASRTFLVPLSSMDAPLGIRDHFLISHVTPVEAKHQFLSGAHVAGLLKGMDCLREIVRVPGIDGAAMRSFSERPFAKVMEDLQFVFKDFDCVMSTIGEDDFRQYKETTGAIIDTREADMTWSQSG